MGVGGLAMVDQLCSVALFCIPRVDEKLPIADSVSFGRPSLAMPCCDCAEEAMPSTLLF
jgi:hypothetical protein